MKRSKHSLSFTKLLTGNVGELLPIGIYEVLPGDTIQQATSVFLRVSPLLSPVMHPVHVRVHFWYVPHRIVWNEGVTNFENFITGGPTGEDASVPPTITVNSGSGWANGSLADYFGIPTGVDDLPVSAIPFRGYAHIWNEFYRDQDLQTALTIDRTDGADTTTNTTLQNVCWEKDYFTSSRLVPQKGPDVVLPLGTRADVKGIGVGAQDFPGSGNVYETGGTGAVSYTNRRIIDPGSGSGTAYIKGTAATNAFPNIYADLSNATAATINELREAMAIQRYQEARARYGSRFTEYLRYLGIRSSDARLQRPEYLGGGKATIQFSEVLQTGVTTSGTPSTGVGSLLGHGIGAMRTARFRRFFEEHGYVFSLLSVIPKTIYGSGLPRHFSRTTKEDYWQKELEHIGQQEVYNREVYWADSAPGDVFGYQDRYDEYRRNESSIAGDFRSALNHWHYARIMSADVTLNAAFVSATPTTRVYQSTTADNLYVMAMHSIQARRLVSKVGHSFTF